MVSIAPNMGNRLTKATIDEAIESLKEEVGPVSESIIVGIWKRRLELLERRVRVIC